MKRFLLASHGPLADAMLESAALIGGKSLLASFSAIGVAMEDSTEKIHGEIERMFADFGEEDEIIALTDCCGGNITNILTEYVGIRNLHIVTGMNLGMVLEAGFSDGEASAEELEGRLRLMGQEGIRYVNAELDSGRMEDEI